MINALNGAVEKIPAPTRAARDDALLRREAPKPAKIALEITESESAVVEISSEGSRRAQEKEREQRLTASAQQATISSERQAAVFAPGLDTGLEQTRSPAPSEAGLVNQDEVAEPLQFDEADANQDGTVNVLEKRAFDFLHPTLERYPGDEEDLLQPAIVAELRAYETVARGGRNL